MRFAAPNYLAPLPERIAPLLEVAVLLGAVSLLAIRYGALSADAPAAPSARDVAPARGASEGSLPPLRVRLFANPEGKLQSLRMNERNFATPAELRTALQQLDETLAELGAHGLEVELDCDYRLAYESIMDVVAALGEPGAGGRKLVERIKFAPPRQP